LKSLKLFHKKTKKLPGITLTIRGVEGESEMEGKWGEVRRY